MDDGRQLRSGTQITDRSCLRHQLAKEFEPLTDEFRSEESCSGDIPARTIDASFQRLRSALQIPSRFRPTNAIKSLPPRRSAIAILETISKDHAAPKPRMPAVTPAANHRCHDDGRYHGRCYDNRARRCNYDWPVRAASSVRTAVKSGTATTGSTGAVDADE